MRLYNVLRRIMARTKGRLSMEEEAIHSRIIELQVEHRDLDDVIARLTALPTADELQLRRLKKKKLQIKDQILQLQYRLVPDIPA
jgi:hypothetical protein